MTTYAPNPFSGQSAQSGALRSYAPNPFQGQTAPGAASMAPHLSTPVSERPHAEDISLLQGSPEYASKVDSGNLDRMWRLSPMSYQQQVAEMLRVPRETGVLSNLRTEKQYAGQNVRRDEEGNILMGYTEEGVYGPLPPLPRRGGDSGD